MRRVTNPERTMNNKHNHQNFEPSQGVGPIDDRSNPDQYPQEGMGEVFTAEERRRILRFVFGGSLEEPSTQSDDKDSSAKRARPSK
jgi:hypothetical protein